MELSIRRYTEESPFVYCLNRIMRNCEKGLISLAYYIGPFLFGLNKYVKENPKYFSFNEDMNLYKYIICQSFDFYLYKMNVNHIICFPSFTPTSLKIYQNFSIRPKKLYHVTMIFKYKHEKGNISPGIIIKDNKAKDGKYISSHPIENEVILFPFTFARITNINKTIKNNIICCEMFLRLSIEKIILNIFKEYY